jgi:hypothetical protein
MPLRRLKKELMNTVRPNMNLLDPVCEKKLITRESFELRQITCDDNGDI